MSSGPSGSTSVCSSGRSRPGGPPNYYLIDAGAGMSGDIRERSHARGDGNVGFVCTVVVDDLKAIRAAIIENGGTIVVPEFRIDGVGNLLYFTDTEGHRVGVMLRDADLKSGA